MRITREADYAVRIALFLAEQKKQVEAKTIAEETCVPYRFTLKILRKLVGGGIAASFRGVNGGYSLKLAPEEVSLCRVIETIDEDIALNACITEPEICSNTKICAVRRRLLAAQQHLRAELDSVKLSDLLEDKKSICDD